MDGHHIGAEMMHTPKPVVLSQDCPGELFRACESYGGPHDGARVDRCHNVEKFELAATRCPHTYLGQKACPPCWTLMTMRVVMLNNLLLLDLK